MQPKKPHAVSASSGAAARAAAHTTERVHIMDDATSPPTGVDTLTVSEDLQKAGFTQPQANSLAHWLGKLVTKEDLRRVATRLNDKIKELHKKIDGVSKEMRDKFEKTNDKIDAKFDKLNDKIDKNVYILLGGVAAATAILSILIVALDG